MNAADKQKRKARPRLAGPTKTVVEPDGRIVVPAAYRRAQERVARALAGPEFSVDAFLAERRREAKRERGRG
ncbi:MAG TPA: hypothetical protein VEK12_18145 [Alphaproteobacteria bacterium]|nr:hypothetical protein [Alphaproteobacteria bacterium]